LKVCFTPSGRNQLLVAIAGIRRDNPEAAVAFRNKVEKMLRRLKQVPESGSLLPECPDLPFREVVGASYRFIYRIREKTIWMVAVWQGVSPPSAPVEDEIA
jgi:toxin ParE1/3/4